MSWKLLMQLVWDANLQLIRQEWFPLIPSSNSGKVLLVSFLKHFNYRMAQVAAQFRPLMHPTTWCFDVTLQLPAFSSAEDFCLVFLTILKDAHCSTQPISPWITRTLVCIHNWANSAWDFTKVTSKFTAMDWACSSSHCRSKHSNTQVSCCVVWLVATVFRQWQAGKVLKHWQGSLICLHYYKETQLHSIMMLNHRHWQPVTGNPLWCPTNYP